MGKLARHIPDLSRRSGACRLAAAAVLALFLAAAPAAHADDAAPSGPPEPAAEHSNPASPTDTDRLPLGSPNSAASLANRSTSQPTHLADSSGLLRTTVSLAFVVSLIVLAAVLAKRVARRKGTGLASALGPGGPSPAGVLEVLGRYPLGGGCRGQTLILLRAHSRILLLSHAAGRLSLSGRASAGSMTPLCEFASPEDAAAILAAIRDADGDSIAARFRSLVSRFDRHDADHAAAPAHDDHLLRRQPRRCAGVSDHGDRAELWDDAAAAPNLHLVGEPVAAVMSRPVAVAADAVTSLQRRLDAMRGVETVGGMA